VFDLHASRVLPGFDPNVKMRADFGIIHDADGFKTKFERRGVRVFTHGPIDGYRTDAKRVVSDRGFDGDPYIETKLPLGW